MIGVAPVRCLSSSEHLTASTLPCGIRKFPCWLSNLRNVSIRQLQPSPEADPSSNDLPSMTTLNIFQYTSQAHVADSPAERRPRTRRSRSGSGGARCLPWQRRCGLHVLDHSKSIMDRCYRGGTSCHRTHMVHQPVSAERANGILQAADPPAHRQGCSSALRSFQHLRFQKASPRRDPTSRRRLQSWLPRRPPLVALPATSDDLML